jgi:hypothetical protein
MTTRIIRLSRPRKPAEPQPAQMQPMEPVIWHETGGWSVGWRDDVEGFPSHAFARAAWLRHATKRTNHQLFRRD